jgi:uncharacterized low-complexity protein
MNKNYKTPFAIAFSAGLMPWSANVAQAELNPFALTELNAGYMQTALAAPAEAALPSKMPEGACGEGKCGTSMKSTSLKMPEGACGEGKCGSAMKSVNLNTATKMPEGACGEGKCGASMKKSNPGTDKKLFEAKCAGHK